MNFKSFLALLALIFLNSCQAKEDSIKIKKIANIAEASGICYSQKRDSLFVVGDEGRVYEIDKKGKILTKAYLGKNNFEGIASDDKKDRLLLAIEGKEHILIIDQKKLRKLSKIKIDREYKGKILLKKDWKHHGLEAITLIDNSIFLSNQSKKFLPKKDPSVIFEIKKVSKKRAKIKSLYDPHIKDISGLDYHEGLLYFVSDTNDMLYCYDIKDKKIINRYHIKPMALEGVAFDNDNFIYFADDDGFVYKSIKSINPL